ncbi:MAG: hypothetical protein WKF84_16395 [Pyrinomonadaceae bacterium]
MLDALRPELWDVMGVEAAAFHESFGDMSAILCALQLESVRSKVLAETNNRLNGSSRLSRIAEQVGKARGKIYPQSADPDCLRNAVNSFFYRNPDTLPPDAPAYALSSAPHSFSRIFTAAFYEALAGMLLTHAKNKNEPTEDELREVSRDMGRLLVEAVAEAPIVPDYFSQVAAHMIELNADKSIFDSKYRDALKSAFVRRGILSIGSATFITGSHVALSARRGIASVEPVDVQRKGPSEVPKILLLTPDYGLAGLEAIVVSAPGQTKRMPVSPAGLAMGALQPRAKETEARSFVDDLFRRGRIDFENSGENDARVIHPFSNKSHKLKKTETKLGS